VLVETLNCDDASLCSSDERSFLRNYTAGMKLYDRHGVWSGKLIIFTLISSIFFL
jgi:hypothetical protein